MATKKKKTKKKPKKTRTTRSAGKTKATAKAGKVGKDVASGKNEVKDSPLTRSKIAEKMIQAIIRKGKKKGYLTYEEMNEELPEEAISPNRQHRPFLRPRLWTWSSKPETSIVRHRYFATCCNSNLRLCPITPAL